MSVKTRKAPKELIEYTQIAKEMNLMIEENPSREYGIRKVNAFGFEKFMNSKKNFAVVEIDERFYQQAMLRILNKRREKEKRIMA